MTPLAIAIAGCGPAGLAAALLLHRQGHRATVFDRFYVPRPLGSGLMIQPTALAVLDRLGLAHELVARGARVRALKGVNEHGRTVLDARYGDLARPGMFGLGVHRASLFEVLHAAVRAAGIPFEGGVAIEGIEAVATGRMLRFDDGTHRGPFDLVIDALGARSPLAGVPQALLPFGALWATLDWPEGGPFDEGLLEQRYRRADRMVGVLPTGRRDPKGKREAAFFWSIRGDEYPAWRARGLSAWKDEVLAMWPQCATLLDQIVDPDQLVFARYSHRTSPQPRHDGLFRIGDAWHSASPQLGQGANMALLDAWALAEGLSKGRTQAEGLRLARRWRADHVRLYQWLTAAFTPLYQSSAPKPATIRDRVIAPLSRVWPISKIQALMVTGLFGSPLGELGLAVPDYEALAPTTSSTSALASGLCQSKPPTTRAIS